MADDLRVVRGWIIVHATRGDDGRLVRGAGEELRLSPFDAVRERRDAQIPWSAILEASVQRLAFWRR
jgi:hypothetical protein